MVRTKRTHIVNSLLRRHEVNTSEVQIPPATPLTSASSASASASAVVTPPKATLLVLLQEVQKQENKLKSIKGDNDITTTVYTPGTGTGTGTGAGAAASATTTAALQPLGNRSDVTNASAAQQGIINDMKCGICLEDIKELGSIACGHPFCATCILEVRLRHHTAPYHSIP